MSEEVYECEGCGKSTKESDKGFLWFFGKPYCPECREALQNDPVDVNDL